ncbi:DegT/DnrJ/EryC1/StrS family aminotransferase [Fibrobacterota bacterium]
MDFIGLKSQYEGLKSGIQERINTVLEHQRFIMGPEVEELERQLAAFAGTRYCVSCASGTDALLMALMSKDVGPGDAIFTTSFSFIATAEVISFLGATPVFVDIDVRTFTMDTEKLKEAVETVKAGGKPSPGSPAGLKPTGIIPVDLFGLPADYEILEPYAKEEGLFILEDAAQGFGSSINGKKAGSFGDVAATSFFPVKPLGCYGDGGAVFTYDDDTAATIQSIRTHGKGSEKYDNVRIGINGRLDTLQAAILLSKLEVFAEEFQTRQDMAARYSEGLKDLVTVPHVPEGYKSAWAQYSVLSPLRGEIMSGLKERGVPTAVYYPKPLHQQTAFAELRYEEGHLPVSEKVSKEIFSLPMHPYLRERDQNEIIDVIATACDKIT